MASITEYGTDLGWGCNTRNQRHNFGGGGQVLDERELHFEAVLEGMGLV
jgi:hypothetical protein